MQPWARTCEWGFFIGPDKSGSSWMQAVLERHPTVAVPQAKDLHFFNRFFGRGLDWYLGHFEVDGDTTCAVEVCHDYLFDPEAIARIARTFPDARFVICARHPAPRAVSSYLYMVRQGRTHLELSRALREIDELVDHGRYHAHLSAVLDHVAPERITVLDFAQLHDDPEAFKARLLAGLGAEPHPFTPEDREPVRAAARPRSRAAARTAKLTAGALRRLRAERALGRLKASPLVERALFRAYAPDARPALSSSDLCYLRTILEPDGEALDRLLGTRFQQDWWHGTNVDGTEFR
jgi:hypothetical protein